MFAIYRTSEMTAKYYNGAWYIVRRDSYPHTHWTDGGMVTKQGHAMLVGIRQGEGNDDHGFVCKRYPLPDSEPTYTPATYPPGEMRATYDSPRLAPFTVTRAGQLCSGNREPIPVGATAYDDGEWVYCASCAGDYA